MENREYGVISAKIVKDSIYNSTRLTTFSIEVPRFLLAQINTHRMVVKNYQSSRAVPTKKLLEQPVFIPQKVGINQSGMVSNGYLDGEQLLEFQKDWLELRDLVADKAITLSEKYNTHKEILNRILEPFSMCKGILTATYDTWQRVNILRLGSDAQPEFQALAKLIDNELRNNTPQELQDGEFHLPFIEHVTDFNNIEDAIKVSASRIAQVSYRNSDATIEKALDIFEKLNMLGNKPHISPVQHIAQALSVNYISDELFDKFHNDGKHYYAEFGDSFIQVSKFIENDKVLVLPELMNEMTHE